MLSLETMKNHYSKPKIQILGKRYKRQVYQPPQVDEQLVSAFLNSPEAVKMVLSYLDKQKPKTTTTTTTTTKRLESIENYKFFQAKLHLT